LKEMQLNKAIQNRWSPRAFSYRKVTKEMIDLLFEAARWAPSAMNEQPWNYYFVHRDNQKTFNEVVEILTGINPAWAQYAQVLIVSVVKKNYDYQNRANKNALHDLGAANVSIAIQAAEMGLQVHQMAGFDKEKATKYLQLENENFEPVTMIAVGFQGDADQLTEDLKVRELQPRKRKEIGEFAFEMKDK
jgi:nitroreductase